MGRESPPFFLEVNGWVQLHGIAAIPTNIHETGVLYTTCTCMCTLYTTNNILDIH